MPESPDRSLGGERLAEPPGPPAAGPDGILPALPPPPWPEPFRVDLPWPPSVNRVWLRAGKGGVRLAPEVKNYRACVGIAVHQARAACGWRTGKFAANLRLRVELVCIEPHRSRTRDLDNLLKALLDALQRAEVFHDDSQVDLLIVRRHAAHPRLAGGAIAVTVTPLRIDGWPGLEGGE